jgi:hypothetical protein
MTHASQGSVFVWVVGDLWYPKGLAERCGRKDLEIVGPGWLENGWRGRELSGLVVDHAAWDALGESKRALVQHALMRVKH